jgi:hypothetical protein
MAPKRSKKAAKPEAAVTETTTEETGNTGLDRVLNRDGVQPNWKAFADFIEEHGGPKINPKHVGIVLTGYKFYQRSDAAVTSREAAQAAKAEAKAEREAAREQRAADRAKAAAERKEAAAAKPAAKKAVKKAAPKKTAAAASKPAAKKTAVKKTAAKKGASRKAAF